MFESTSHGVAHTEFSVDFVAQTDTLSHNSHDICVFILDLRFKLSPTKGSHR